MGLLLSNLLKSDSLELFLFLDLLSTEDFLLFVSLALKTALLTIELSEADLLKASALFLLGLTFYQVMMVRLFGLAFTTTSLGLLVLVVGLSVALIFFELFLLGLDSSGFTGSLAGELLETNLFSLERGLLLEALPLGLATELLFTVGALLGESSLLVL